MSDPHVYPEAPNAPLWLPAATGVAAPTFMAIEQLAAPDPTTPNIPKTMFIRVAMSGNVCPGVTSATAPNFYVRADSDDAVLINDHTQPPNLTNSIFRKPGSNPVDFVGEGSAFLESNNVFRLVITFNDGAGNYAWQLGIWNNDASAARQFTWVVSGTVAGTSQPWVHVTYRDAVPANIRFDAVVGHTTAVEHIEITNRGTSSVTLTGVTPAIAAPFTITGLPATLEPNPRAPAVVMLGFDVPSTPGDTQARTFRFVTTNKPDNGPFGAGHNVQFTLSGHAAAASNTWLGRAPMPSNRAYLGFVAANNGKLYAIGGHPLDSTNEEYDPATNSWTSRKPMPTPRGTLGLVAANNGKIYAIGGQQYPAGVQIIVGVVEEYDPATDTWTTKAPMPTLRYGFATAIAGNGRIYTIGGSGPPRQTVVEEYDPATNSWALKAPSIAERSYHSAVGASNGRIYITGGGGENNMVRTVEEYNPATNTWTSRAPMPTGRATFGFTAAGSKIYAVGGLSGHDAIAAMEEYDPATDSWAVKAPMPTPRYSLAAATAGNGKIYAVGGGSPVGVGHTLEEYTP